MPIIEIDVSPVVVASYRGVVIYRTYRKDFAEDPEVAIFRLNQGGPFRGSDDDSTEEDFLFDVRLIPGCPKEIYNFKAVETFLQGVLRSGEIFNSPEFVNDEIKPLWNDIPRDYQVRVMRTVRSFATIKVFALSDVDAHTRALGAAATLSFDGGPAVYDTVAVKLLP